MEDRNEFPPRPASGPPVDVKKRALVALTLTLVLAIGAWFGLNRAAVIGGARLQAYDRARAACVERYAKALNSNDSVRVDESALSEVLDNGASGAPRRCVDLVNPTSKARG